MKCSVEVAPRRAAPLESSEQVTQALLGEPLQIEERCGRWARVKTAYGYEGWLVDEALAEGEGALPPPNDLLPLEVARSFLGTPYAWGGLSTAGIDCSGLVHIAYRLTGRLVPRDAWQQEQAGAPVNEADIALGDLITFGGADRATHIAFWAGEGRILHATGLDSRGVIEEHEPGPLRARRRAIVSLRVLFEPASLSAAPNEGRA
jgi:cell wall-associated NlpC family hydrolase